MSRDERVRPLVSSFRACRVRSASVNPKAARRVTTASDGEGRAVAPRVRLIQQGAEEEVLVDGPHRRLLAGEVAGQQLAGAGLGGVPVAHDPGQAVHGLAAGGQGVDLLLGHQLEAVLDGAQQAVGVVEGPGVVGLDVAAGAQLGQGVEGGGRPQGGVVAAVDQLQELDGELDVADAAPAPLHLPVGEALAGQLGLGPGLHDRARPAGPRR